MGWDVFTEFDLDPAKNVFLFFENGRSRITILGILGMMAFVLWVSASVIDPNWHPHLHGRGSWIVALLLLMPIAVRAAIFAITTGLLAEAGYRIAVRCSDGKPDLAIGVSGIADLNPWGPRVVLWRDLRDIRRTSTSPGLFARSKSLGLQFVALRQRPSWLSPVLWNAIPTSMIERRILIAPDLIGMDDEQVRRLVERYNGPTSITERTI